MKVKSALSICIATHNRGAFIRESLDSITSQLTDAVELVIVDGASVDNTTDVVQEFQSGSGCVNYFREPSNSGVDADFDKAVGYARGEYCWLMTDDDILADGAVEDVLRALKLCPQLIVVNSELRSRDFAACICPKMLPLERDEDYLETDSESIFVGLANYMSFIGCVVFNRNFWLSRHRDAYYGSLFIHVGVAFQDPPISNVYVISRPLVVIRYGNAKWTPRRFEIWMFMWPALIWSFDSISSKARGKIVARKPWRSVKNMLLYKAMGGYGLAEYQKFIKPATHSVGRCIYYLLAISPASAASFLAVCVLVAFGARKSPELYDILVGQYTGSIARWLARRALEGDLRSSNE